MSKFFGLSKQDIAELSDEEIQELNARMDFVRRARPDAWLDLADELHNAAEVIWLSPDPRLFLEVTGTRHLEGSEIVYRQTYRKIREFSRTYFLLAGYAIENLAKGLLIARRPQLITSGTLSKDLHIHKLSTLLNKVDDLNCTDTEKEFARFAERAIPYWGRYPVPKRKESIEDEEVLTERLRRAYLGLRQRLRGLLDQELEGGWDSGVGSRTLSESAACSRFQEAVSGDTQSSNLGDGILPDGEDT